MVIKDDPTLMFTNAGMNQWKDIILGNKQPDPVRYPGCAELCLRIRFWTGRHPLSRIKPCLILPGQTTVWTPLSDDTECI